MPDLTTYIYEYDDAGNLISTTEFPYTDGDPYYEEPEYIKSYGYSTGNWGDLLTSFDGGSITYDAIGNPTKYHDGKTFTWEGRRLVGATANSKALSFVYNDEGIRTSKTVAGVTTNYYLNGSQIIGEETNGNVTVYLYNSTGIIGFQYRASTYAANTWDTYFYEKNLQGDIVAVYTEAGVKKISYTYDAWGNFTASYHNGASASTLSNPFTYRGYYYDKDLSLYYLNSRYYDSETGRFINADGLLNASSMLGYNLFAYCENNPVMFVDPNGEFLGVGSVFATVALSVASVFALAALFQLAVQVVSDVIEVAADAISETAEAISETADAVQNLFQAKDESKEKDKEAVVTDANQYNYWTVNIVNKVIVPGEPLTYSEALEWVAAEKNLLCRDRGAAFAIIRFYPAAVRHDPHKGGASCGYLNHYHLNKAGKHQVHKNHIWYYGE